MTAAQNAILLKMHSKLFSRWAAVEPNGNVSKTV